MLLAFQQSGNLCGGSNLERGGRRPSVGQMEAKVKDLYGINIFPRFNGRVYCLYMRILYLSGQGHKAFPLPCTSWSVLLCASTCLLLHLISICTYDEDPILNFILGRHKHQPRS